MVEKSKSDFEREIRRNVQRFGGFYNAHTHGDRAFTYDDSYYDHEGLSISEIERLSLSGKQSLVWALHTGKAFTKECIEDRILRAIRTSIKYGVTRLDTTVDTTYNTGLKSLEVAEKLKTRFKDKFDLRIGAYNVSGFKDSAPERFEIFEEAAKKADFIVALAEKDRKPKHIGERQHNIYMLNLALELNKPVHFHVDQANIPEEKGMEQLLDDIHEVMDIHHRTSDYPVISAIHVISPSCYFEDRFQRLCDRLLEYKVEIICCPSAALSMRQHREYQTPIHNSIARVWDFALKGIPVKLGTDNINDVFVPASSPDLYDEVKDLANSLRVYNPRALAKLASGTELDNFDKERVKEAFD